MAAERITSKQIEQVELLVDVGFRICMGALGDVLCEPGILQFPRWLIDCHRMKDLCVLGTCFCDRLDLGCASPGVHRQRVQPSLWVAATDVRIYSLSLLDPSSHSAKWDTCRCLSVLIMSTLNPRLLVVRECAHMYGSVARLHTQNFILLDACLHQNMRIHNFIRNSIRFHGSFNFTLNLITCGRQQL